MSNIKNEETKKKLLSEKEEIQKRMETLKSGDPFEDPDHVTDNASVDTDVREQESHQRIEAELDTLKTRLNNIEEAVQQIEKGTYGTCKRCNQSIPEKRLELIPEAVYCVKCEDDLKK